MIQKSVKIIDRSRRMDLNQEVPENSKKIKFIIEFSIVVEGGKASLQLSSQLDL
jgi:hypothetical protein